MLNLLEERGSPQFKEIVGDAYAKAATDAHPAEIDNVAAKLVRNAGWYKTGGGEWKQLTPDLRNKINIRAGVKQPDGQYLIEDVDVFYPNRVKGDDPHSNYTPERIRGFIDNTNRMINNGGQPPAVVREHPSPEKRANGIPSPASGHSFAFRESPRGGGMARCNLLISEPLYKEWKDGKWIGLSAGFACDKAGSNMRFGHIALLGADMQALSNLPRVEVFEADNQLVFAADSSVFNPKGTSMPRQLTDAQKAAFNLIAGAHEKAKLAFQATAAGADDADQLEADAKEAFAAADAVATSAGVNFQAPREDEGNPLYNEDANSVYPADPELDALLADEPAATIEALGGAGAGRQAEAAPTTGDAGDEDEGEDDAPAAPSGGGNAEKFAAMQAEIDANRKVISALIGKQMRQEFQAFMDTKLQAGHQFDSGAMMQLFQSVASQPKSIDAIKRLITGSPKDPKLAAPTFSATEAQTNVAGNNSAMPAASVDDTMAVLRKYCPSVEFKAEDVTLGSIAAPKR